MSNRKFIFTNSVSEGVIIYKDITFENSFVKLILLKKNKDPTTYKKNKLKIIQQY